MDPKWHKNFIASRAKLVNKISDENCNIRISFPKTANSSQVTLKGPREAVESAKKQILDCVVEFENQVTLEVAVPQNYHQVIIGKQGINSQQISNDYNVEIKFPAKSNSEHTQQNGSVENNHADNENNSNAGMFYLAILVN